MVFTIVITIFAQFDVLTDFHWQAHLNKPTHDSSSTVRTINQTINTFTIDIRRQKRYHNLTIVKNIISDNNGNKCFIWYAKGIHPEILPSIIESFLNLKQNITDFYIIVPAHNAQTFNRKLNGFYRNHISKPSFSLTCLVNRNGFPSYILLSKLTKNDIVILTTVYWGPKTLQSAFSVIDIKNKHSLEFKYLLMFHMLIWSVNKRLIDYYKAFENQTYYALCLTPTFKLYESQMIPIIPTYTYTSVNPNPKENFKFHCRQKEKGDKYIIIMQGGEDNKRDRKLLWNVLSNKIFQQRLQSYFLFKWYGFIRVNEQSQIDRELFLGKYNKSLQVFIGLDDVNFVKGVSYGDIYFTMISENTIGDYSKGTKFTSTLIYSFAMEKPVLVYEEVVNKWEQTFGNVSSFLSYRNSSDIINILLRVVESDTYYDELCTSATKINQIIREENAKNLQVLFEME